MKISDIINHLQQEVFKHGDMNIDFCELKLRTDNTPPLEWSDLTIDDSDIDNKRCVVYMVRQ
jgi:hypothetical protein